MDLRNLTPRKMEDSKFPIIVHAINLLPGCFSAFKKDSLLIQFSKYKLLC